MYVHWINPKTRRVACSRHLPTWSVCNPEAISEAYGVALRANTTGKMDPWPSCQRCSQLKDKYDAKMLAVIQMDAAAITKYCEDLPPSL